MRLKSIVSHSFQAVVEASLLALMVTALLTALIAGSVFAAKGGGPNKPSGTGTIALAMVTDANANGSPNWGDTVTFNVSTTATTHPHVRLQCSQSGVLVYSAQAGMYATYLWPWLQNMTLTSSSWTGGAADCIAQIYYFSGSKTVWSSSLSFHVDA